MDTTLIDSYLINLTSSRQEKMLKTLENIQALLEDSVVSMIFSFPGITVSETPVCNLRFSGSKIRIRFFQRELFNDCKKELTDFDCGNTSIAVSSPDEVLATPFARLLRCSAKSAQIDAQFKRRVGRTNSGFFDRVSISQKKQKGPKETV